MANISASNSMVELLVKGFRSEFEKEVSAQLEEAAKEFDDKVQNIIQKAEKRAIARAAAASVEILQEANLALFDLRFQFKKD